MIKIGDTVKSLDFPFSDEPIKSTCFVEGLVTDASERLMTIKVTRDVWEGKDTDTRVGFELKAPQNGQVSMFGETCGITLIKESS
jgi:hypothetical protein